MISNFRKVIMFITTTILLYSCQKNVDRVNNSDMVDINGNSYPTTSIGSQIWAAQNLDVNRYRNGDIIPHITNDSVWATLTTGAWCYYNNDSTLGKTYGKLYNHFAVTDPRGLSPEGWRVGSDSDWHILSNYLGGDSLSVGKMKESGTTHWLIKNDLGTNSSGFTGIPSGVRGEDGSFVQIGNTAWWWSSNFIPEHNCSAASGKIRGINGENISHSGNLVVAITKVVYGLSVRCVKN